ncbi:hypothetical protein AB5J55_35160 [Streptomyces sp. R11]|uniref:Uncharacterized protein n=1 Tax=Streptomyces sp. R11 TaxID=3238625 RepID=A0AB39N7Q4_9ACTN
MNQPLTNLDLDEIASRAAHLYEYVNVTDEAAQPDFDQLTGTDVTALLAEARRLRDANAQLDRMLGEAIDDRDQMHEIADKLAYAVAPEEVIGEHSSMNCPWTNALDLITPKAEVDKLRAEVATARGQAIAWAADVVDAKLTTEPDHNRASALYELLLRLRGELRCTCARSGGLHAEGCRKYVPGHELISPVNALAAYRAATPASAVAVSGGEQQ